MILLERLLGIRYLAAVAELFSLISGAALLALGVYKFFRAYTVILGGVPVGSEKGPGILILESIDVFLAALASLVLALGLAQLFLVSDDRRDALQIPSWMKVRSFLELKLLLREVVLTVLVIAFLGYVASHVEVLHRETLILPASILMLSVSLYIMKKIARDGH
jgi:uncharacterized membrane protein YqhA